MNCNWIIFQVEYSLQKIKHIRKFMNFSINANISSYNWKWIFVPEYYLQNAIKSFGQPRVLKSKVRSVYNNISSLSKTPVRQHVGNMLCKIPLYRICTCATPLNSNPTIKCSCILSLWTFKQNVHVTFSGYTEKKRKIPMNY